MPFKILVMGLPGAGKTTLASAIKTILEDTYTVEWLNADTIRTRFNDWDFSSEGRIRQSMRMVNMANVSNSEYVIADFIAPLEEMRATFDADYTIWVDTVTECKYADTNKAFIPPEKYDVRVTEQDAIKWANTICNTLIADQVTICKFEQCD